LTLRVDWFTPGQLQAQILNVTDPNAAGSSLLARPKALSPAAGHRPSCWVLVENGPKMLDPNGGRVQLALGHGGRQGPKLLGHGGRQGPKLLGPGDAGPN
jgi:hypothetical protein